jgi:tetratricopeptide (TPR) repeat protein
MRLRRQAKWVFLALALVFCGGFIFFGVGTGNSGLGDIFAEGGFFRGGGESISKLQKQTVENPGNAEAWRKLASALRGKERNEEAITPLERYTQLRPKDAAALQELALLYLERARRYYEELTLINYQLAAVPGSGFALSPTSFLAKELQKDPFYKAIVADLSNRQAEVAGQLNGALTSRADALKRAVGALPADDTSLPGVVFSWAQAAEDAQDFKTALQAYQRYLKLAPDSALAADARQAVKRVQAILKSQQAGGSGTSSG